MKSKYKIDHLPSEFRNHPAVQYACDLVDGKITAGTITIAAAQRFFRDIAQANEKGFVFDLEKAVRIINFFPTCLRHTVGSKAGQPFELEPFQQFFLFNIFGWYTATGERRFKSAYLKMAKKNGKTAFAAGIQIYCTGFEGEAGAQVYSAATKEEQAKLVWSQSAAFIDKSPILKQAGFVNYKTRIEFTPTGSFIKALGRDSNTQDGINAYVSIIDEYHAHPTDEVRDNLTSSMVARDNPLEIIITTAGKYGLGKCKEHEDYCKEILADNPDFQNETVFALIFDLDKTDDWKDENNWQKSNPGLGTILKIERLREDFIRAVQTSSYEKTFKTKNLNIWVSSFEADWISDRTWEKGNSAPNIEKIKEKCYVGMDLAVVTDLCAVCFFSEPDENGVHHSEYMFFMPKESLEEKEKKFKVPFQKWIEQGFITATDGAYTDYAVIRNFLNDKRNDGYNMEWIGLDPYNAWQLMNELEDDGFNHQEFPQNITVISEPTKGVEKYLLSGKILHGGNPVLNWMRSNVVIYHDANGNIKMHKGKSKAQIDGMIALVVAYGGYLKAITEDQAPDYSEGLFIV